MPGSGTLCKQLVESNGKVADAFAGGVKDGVRDGCGCTGDTNFADALGADRVDVVIFFIHPDCFDVPDVEICRD